MALQENQLLTVEDWLAACREGAPVLDLVAARAQRLLGDSPAVAWIHRAGPEDLRQRLQALELIAAAAPSRAALLAAHPLFGVPFVVKDNIDVAGWPTTAACPDFGYLPAQSATVVRKLLDAGAVLLGKSNLDQFATGLVGTRSPHGAPSCVFAADRISGGSSSGSSVLVGRGDVAFSLGTDTAGSGRVPAGFNQVVGLKPTPGRVSTAGVLPACRSIDCVSVFALTVDDAATVLTVIEGPDGADEFSRFETGPAVLAGKAPGARLRVGVPAIPVLGEFYTAPWQAALRRLESLGAEVVPVDFTALHQTADLLYEGPWVAERYAVIEALLRDSPQSLDATVRKVIQRAEGLTAVDTFRAMYTLQKRRSQLAALWGDIDLLMVPTAPRHPSHEEVASDPVGTNSMLGTYTNFVNLLGWSALALPSGTTTEGLPFGVTFIGPPAADAALVSWGRQWARAAAMPLGSTGRRGPSSQTGLLPGSEATMPLAVVGAHLSGLPLNGQLTERGARLLRATRTAACYRLFALPGTVPPKPGLLRVAEGGQAIEIEVWAMPQAALGSFLALVPSPLGLGTLVLEDGTAVHGFICEPFALQGALDVTDFGGWRAYVASRRNSPAAD